MASIFQNQHNINANCFFTLFLLTILLCGTLPIVHNHEGILFEHTEGSDNVDSMQNGTTLRQSE